MVTRNQMRFKLTAGLGLVTLFLATTTLSLGQDQQAAPSPVRFKTLVTFDGANGAMQLGSGLYLRQGTDGNLYGTTTFGGANTPFCGTQCGTFFKMTPAGNLTTLYTFCAQPNCADGAQPDDSTGGSIALGTDGNFYGTAANFGDYGDGTLFKISPSGTLTTLYEFCPDGPNCINGDISFASLVQGIDGNLYGVTPSGGLNTTGPCGAGVYSVGCGTVFKVTPAGMFTSIYSFCSQPNCADGASPGNTLLAAADGQLYGITANGGANGWGTIFRISTGGKFTTLYSFPSYTGCFANPSNCGPLMQANDGNIYGAAWAGGTNNSGFVFKVTPAGALSSLYNFCAQPNCTDGSEPVGVVQGTDGAFYGTTYTGGTQTSTCPYSVGCGTVFRLTGSGVLKTLHSFGGPDGSSPTGLVQATNGAFYGLTSGGGSSSQGTIFSLSLGLGPFVELLPASGKVGATVRILGSNLTGASAVSFNGTAAAFMVISKTLISVTVPAGATTGLITVTTTSGALKSNVRFVVRP